MDMRTIDMRPATVLADLKRMANGKPTHMADFVLAGQLLRPGVLTKLQQQIRKPSGRAARADATAPWNLPQTGGQA